MITRCVDTAALTECFSVGDHLVVLVQWATGYEAYVHIAGDPELVVYVGQEEFCRRRFATAEEAAEYADERANSSLVPVTTAPGGKS